MMDKLEIFPTPLFFRSFNDVITDTILSKIEHISENMCEKIAHSHALWSKNNIHNVLDLSKFDDFKKFQINLVYNIGEEYSIGSLSLGNSYIVKVPKDGFIQIQKTFDTSFCTLVNLSRSSNIIFSNPNSYFQSKKFNYLEPNKYNSEYATIPFEKNMSITFPSHLQYGFTDLPEDLVYLCVNIN
jgi:hypothetical protein